MPTLSLALDLSHNSFGGPIPEEIGNLINLVEFHAESNNFTGNIPDRLGECQLLRYLYLQNNFFSGNVPSPLGQLKRFAIS
jgi:Leucine-rich repeat (LRR) protein